MPPRFPNAAVRAHFANANVDDTSAWVATLERSKNGPLPTAEDIAAAARLREAELAAAELGQRIDWQGRFNEFFPVPKAVQNEAPAIIKAVKDEASAVQKFVGDDAADTKTPTKEEIATDAKCAKKDNTVADPVVATDTAINKLKAVRLEVEELERVEIEAVRRREEVLAQLQEIEESHRVAAVKLKEARRREVEAAAAYELEEAHQREMEAATARALEETRRHEAEAAAAREMKAIRHREAEAAAELAKKQRAQEQSDLRSEGYLSFLADAAAGKYGLPARFRKKPTSPPKQTTTPKNGNASPKEKTPPKTVTPGKQTASPKQAVSPKTGTGQPSTPPTAPENYTGDMENLSPVDQKLSNAVTTSPQSDNESGKSRAEVKSASMKSSSSGQTRVTTDLLGNEHLTRGPTSLLDHPDLNEVPITPIGGGEHFIGRYSLEFLDVEEYYPIANPKILYELNKETGKVEVVHPDSYVELCRMKDGNRNPDGTARADRNLFQSRFLCISNLYPREIPKEYLDAAGIEKINAKLTDIE